jgi:hypothetical protein
MTTKTTVYEVTGVARRTAIGVFPTFDAALAYVETLNPVLLEPDADHPGCADAFLPDTRILAIEAA